MKKIFLFSFLISASLAGAADPATVLTREQQQAMTPAQALDRLKAGNKRFVSGQMIYRDLRDQVQTTATGQFPFATIVACQDSRTSSDLIFDMGKGDAFHIRIAGNIINEDILGGLEFGTKVTGAKIILVMGHTSCGAIRGAIDGVELGNLTTLLWKIEPSIPKVTDASLTPRTSANAKFVDAVAEKNVRTMMNQITAQSPIIKEQVEKKEIIIVGAMYDIATGEVHFLE